MVESGFTCDPEVVRYVGNTNLPGLAEALIDVGKALVGTEQYWADAFREDRTPTRACTPTPPSCGVPCANTSTRSREAARRIDRAGDALVSIATNYCATDADMAAGVLSIIEDQP